MLRWLLGLLVVACLSPLEASAQVGATFDYRGERVVTGTGGTYAGWSDILRSTGHYQVVMPDEAEGPERTGGPWAVHATYQWRYTSPEHPDSGAEDRHVTIDPASRTYLGPRTDLDDYDEELAWLNETWIWIPADARVGHAVRILGEDFDVLSVDESVEVAGASRHAIHVEHESQGERHDDYGDFTTRAVDEYWFDRNSGMFLRELITETDQNGEASFQLHEETVVVDATYAPHVGPIPPDPMLTRDLPGASVSGLPIWGVPAMVGGVIVIAFFALRRMVRPATRVTLGGREITVAKLGPSDVLTPSVSETTISFGPLVAHFVDVARRTGDAVYTSTAGGRIVGLAIDDRTSGVASIFARDPDVCELLRRSLGRNDFFSELRHGNLPSVIDATQKTTEKLPASVAYNVLETYEVLELPIPGEPTYDNAVIARVEPPDLTDAARVLTSVLGTDCDGYLRAAHGAGDIVYAAREGDQIVGVGLATVVGETGRLHTLAVLPTHRNRGLGRELVRARIRAMATLGAKRIVTEVSTRNAASLEIVRGEGFAQVGSMYIESARDTAPLVPVATVRL